MINYLLPIFSQISSRSRVINSPSENIPLAEAKIEITFTNVINSPSENILNVYQLFIEQHKRFDLDYNDNEIFIMDTILAIYHIPLSAIEVILLNLIREYKVKQQYSNKEEFLDDILGHTLFEINKFIEATNIQSFAVQKDYNLYYRYDKGEHEKFFYMMDYKVGDEKFFARYLKKVEELVINVDYDNIISEELKFEESPFENEEHFNTFLILSNTFEAKTEKMKWHFIYLYLQDVYRDNSDHVLFTLADRSYFNFIKEANLTDIKANRVDKRFKLERYKSKMENLILLNNS